MNPNHQLLQSLYLTVSGKYLKFKVRFDKAIHSGRFYKLSKRKQSSLISRLKKLYERLKSLQTQLRIAGAGAALAVTLSVSNPLQAQSSLGPFERNDALNPFPPPVVIGHPRPAVVDIDNDGDLDVFVGTVNGDIQFFINESPQDSVTRFVEVTGSDNPLDGVNKGSESALAFSDVDGDGDFDMLLGIYSAETYFFRNTGSPTNPVFIEQTGGSNPFNGIEGTGNMYGYGLAIPVFVDLDGDTDMDLVLGSSYVDADGTPFASTEYHENNAGVFTQVNDPAIAAPVAYYSNVALTFADIDNDGDLDAFAGTSSTNSIVCFKQEVEGIFVSSYGSWDSEFRTGNPFQGFGFSKYASPSPVAADFDGDGDLDFLVGVRSNYSYTETSNLRYFENTDGKFTLEDHTSLNISPFGGVDVGGEATPTFVDLDNDGDLDAVIGEKYGGSLSVFIFKDGKFYADPNHQLVNILDPLSNTYDVVPVFVDIDDDGDQDIFVCQDYGYGINFFRNDGGDFVLETSPLEDAQDLRNVSLAFIDVDDDGDLDALVGNYTSYGPLPIVYFQNNGTASNPNFSETTSPSPFDDLGFEKDPNVYAVDLDHDGDTDLVVSETYYNGWYGDDDATRTWFFENNGNGSFINPSDPIIIENTPESFTSFADTDGDGDLDAFIGNGASLDYDQDGKVFFFENTNPPPVTSINITSLEVVGSVPTVIDPTLTIEDSDSDDIVRAIVTISNFVPGEEVLDYDEMEGITGVFNDEEGTLTLSGRGSMAAYENILREVTFNYLGVVPGARRSSPSGVLDITQDITFEVLDTDFTLTTVSVVSLNIVPGNQTEIEVFNAISPADEALNQYFNIRFIETVSPENKVSIYNRWGDLVFDVRDYRNSISGKRFEGISNNGKELPTGTYFYKIEITGKTITGYLSLKR